MMRPIAPRRDSRRASLCVLILCGFLDVVAASPARPAALFDAPFTSFMAGPQPAAVTIADVNGDAYPDLVVANGATRYITVLLNRAGAGFEAGPVIRVEDGPAAIVAADLNRDGKLDLAVANEQSGSVTVALQTGGLVFQTARYAAGAAPHALALADWDRNGTLDLFVASATGDSIGLLQNRGDGTFEPDTVVVDLRTGTKRFRALAAADLDGNGRVDLVGAYGCNGSCLSPTDSLRVAVVLGSAAGFGPPALYSIGGSARPGDPILPRGPAESIAVGDFDADGSPDLAVVNSSPRAVAVLLNRGLNPGASPRRLEFRLAGRFAVGRGPTAIVSADMDASPDGVLDLAVLNSGASTVSVLRGVGNGTFESHVEHRSLGESRALAIGDLDLDGRPDMVVAGGLHDVAVLQRTPSGGFGFAHETRLADAPSAIAFTRVNGDAVLDAVVAGADAGRVRRLGGNGNGAFPTALGSVAVPGAASIALGDLDHDGQADVVAVGPESDSVFVLRGGGNGGFRRSASLALATRASPAAVAIGDLQRQGVQDVVVATRESLAVAFGSPANRGAGRLSFQWAPPVFVGHTPSAIALEDLDRNGALDVVVAVSGDDAVRVLMNPDSTLLFGTDPVPLRTIATGVDPRGLAIADLDGDGRLDLAVACRGAGGTVTLLLGDGGGGFQHRFDLAAGAGPRAVTAADFDRDGKLDLAVANEGSNTVTVFRAAWRGSPPAEPIFETSEFGTGDAPVAIASGDVNLDGAMDIAIANQRSASILVLLGRPAAAPGDAVQFDTVTGATEVRLSWSLPTSMLVRVSDVVVERAEDPAGEFVTRTTSPLVPAPAMDWADAEVTPGRSYWYRLLLRERDGKLTIAGPVEVRVTQAAIAARTFIAVPFEPPSGSPVRIRMGVQLVQSPARLAIYDVAGRRVWDTRLQWPEPGEHLVLWDRRAANGARVPRGVYFVQLESSGRAASRKFVLLHR